MWFFRPPSLTPCIQTLLTELVAPHGIPGATLNMRPAPLALEEMEWRQTPPPVSTAPGSFRLRRGSRFTWRKECLAVMERYGERRLALYCSNGHVITPPGLQVAAHSYPLGDFISLHHPTSYFNENQYPDEAKREEISNACNAVIQKPGKAWCYRVYRGVPCSSDM